MSRLVTARTASMSSVTGSPFAPVPSDRVVIYEPFARSVSRAGLRSTPRARVGTLEGSHQFERDALYLGRPLVGEIEDGVDVGIEGRLVEVAEEQHDHGDDLVDGDARCELAAGVGALHERRQLAHEMGAGHA